MKPWHYYVPKLQPAYDPALTIDEQDTLIAEAQAQNEPALTEEEQDALIEEAAHSLGQQLGSPSFVKSSGGIKSSQFLPALSIAVLDSIDEVDLGDGDSSSRLVTAKVEEKKIPKAWGGN